MRIPPVAAVLLAAAATLLAAPVQAADSALSLAVVQRWQTQASPGTWTAYEVSVQNEGATDFTGDVYLVPAGGRSGAQLNLWPRYRAHVTVPRSSGRSLGFSVLQAPNGYAAEIRDQSGHQLATATAPAGAAGAYAIGLLTDVHDGDSRITSLRPVSSPHSISLTRFPTVQSFPNHAVELNGLSAVVIDQFDSGSLSQAQVQSLRDFVGLGGSLVITGGSAWRRTLQPLPAELLPLKPTGSGTASLESLAGLADLGPGAGMVPVPVVTGELQSGRAVLGAPGAPPLEVEGHYGAGRLLELTFDPFAAPLDAAADLATISWSQALSRAVIGLPNNGSRGFGPGASSGAGGVVYTAAARPSSAVQQTSLQPAVGSPPAYPGGVEAGISTLLRDTPQAATPPLGSMAGLLIAYILLTGPLAYLGLRALHRRELMWVAVPTLALLFTGIAYGAGASSRGGDFFDNEVEIQRLGPDGVTEARAYHGLFAPHRGDYVVRMPANTLVTSALGTYESFGSASTQGAQVTVGTRPQLDVTGAAVWSMQTVQTLTVVHQAGTVDAHITVTGSHVHGTISNHLSAGLERLQVVAAGDGAAALVAAGLAPGASITIDAEMAARGAAGLPPIKGGAPPPPAAAPTGLADKKDSILALAASDAISGNWGEYSLVAVTTPLTALEVGGGRPTRSALAAVIAPISLDSNTSLPPSGQRSRLVSSYFSSLRAAVDVYDLETSPGLGYAPRLSYQLPALAPGLPPSRVGVLAMDVYDWSSGEWLPLRRSSGGQPTLVDLGPGELSGPAIRVRVNENLAGSANLQLVAPAQPA